MNAAACILLIARSVHALRSFLYVQPQHTGTETMLAQLNKDFPVTKVHPLNLFSTSAGACVAPLFARIS